MDFLNRMNQVVEYIEDHLTDDIDFTGLPALYVAAIINLGEFFPMSSGYRCLSMSGADGFHKRRLSSKANAVKLLTWL